MLGRMAQPTNTLHVKVTDVRYPVTEEVVKQVFGQLGAIERVHILPDQQPNTAVAIVQVSDPATAESCRAQRHGRCIYSDCNRMEINFTKWESFVPTAVLGSAPAQMITGPYDAANFQQMMAGRGGMMGASARGRGGRGGAPQMGAMMGGIAVGGGGQNMPPGMAMAPGMPPGMPQGMPGMPMQGMPMPGMPGMPGMHMMNPQMIATMSQNAQGQGQAQDNPFISVAHLDENIPLQYLFVLCELYGHVCYIRRNFSKPQILTVKFKSFQEAQTAATYIKELPVCGSNVNARTFGHFTERSGVPPGEGDPNDPACRAYNFDSPGVKHRAQNARCRCSPNEKVRIYGLKEVTSDDVHKYYESIGCPPISTVCDDETRGIYILEYEDIANAIKSLILSHGHVCGNESATVSFLGAQRSGGRGGRRGGRGRGEGGEGEPAVADGGDDVAAAS